MKLLHEPEDAPPQALQNPRGEIEDVGANLTDDALPIDDFIVHFGSIAAIRHYKIADTVENHDSNRDDFENHSITSVQQMQAISMAVMATTTPTIAIKHCQP